MPIDPRIAKAIADATRVARRKPFAPDTIGPRGSEPRATPQSSGLSWRDFVPILGDARSGADAKESLETGHPVRAALLAAGSLLPMVGGIRKASKLKSLGRGIEAWHGSPRKFERFSLDKASEANWKRSYGSGLYVADDPKVAEQYRRLYENDPPGHLYRANLDVSPDELLDRDLPLTAQSKRVRDILKREDYGAAQDYLGRDGGSFYDALAEGGDAAD